MVMIASITSLYNQHILCSGAIFNPAALWKRQKWFIYDLVVEEYSRAEILQNNNSVNSHIFQILIFIIIIIISHIHLVKIF